MKIILKRFFITISFLACITCNAGGRLAGNGGGVVFREDKYITIGSAQIPIQKAKSLEEISGLNEAIAGVESLDISKEVKSTLLKGLMISMQRHYFWLNDLKKLDPKTYQRLLQEYGEIARRQGLPQSDRMTIVAITSESKTCLVRPIFESLIDNQARAAILFHEALRVSYPDVSTDNVVQLEMAFEDFIRGKNDVRIYYEIATLLEPFDDLPVFKAYLAHDLKKGMLQNFVHFDENGTSPYIELSSLLGDALTSEDVQATTRVLLQCRGSFSGIFGETFILNFDPIKWRSRLNELRSSTSGSESNKKSLFLGFLIQNFETIQPVLTLDASSTGRLEIDLKDSNILQLFPKESFSLKIDPTINSPANQAFNVRYSNRGFEGNLIQNPSTSYAISLLMPQSKLYPLFGPLSPGHTPYGVPEDVSRGFLLDQDLVDSLIRSER